MDNMHEFLSWAKDYGVFGAIGVVTLFFIARIINQIWGLVSDSGPIVVKKIVETADKLQGHADTMAAATNSISLSLERGHQSHSETNKRLTVLIEVARKCIMAAKKHVEELPGQNTKNAIIIHLDDAENLLEGLQH